MVAKKQLFEFIIGVSILLVIVFVVIFVLRQVPNTRTNLSSGFTQALRISPTPLPFIEMTIPYLRSRSYRSNLASLEQAQSFPDYTGYLTSYQSDGLKINALLTKPSGDMPSGGWPAIVFIHGYIPPAQYATLERYVEYVDYLARKGFVVLKIDLRGHGNSQGKAGGGYFGSDYVVDTLNAYAALQGVDFVNKKKIGLWGHSMAGNIVLRSFAAKPGIPAVVIWAGAVYSYSDQVKYGIHDSTYHPPEYASEQQNRRKALIDTYGTPSQNSFFWRQVAPTNYLNDLKGVIEIHHAEDDTVVSIGYSLDLIALLDKTHVPHQFYTYPTGGHNISGDSFDLAMQRTVDFFKKYL